MRTLIFAPESINPSRIYYNELFLMRFSQKYPTATFLTTRKTSKKEEKMGIFNDFKFVNHVHDVENMKSQVREILNNFDEVKVLLPYIPANRSDYYRNYLNTNIKMLGLYKYNLLVIVLDICKELDKPTELYTLEFQCSGFEKDFPTYGIATFGDIKMSKFINSWHFNSMNNDDYRNTTKDMDLFLSYKYQEDSTYFNVGKERKEFMSSPMPENNDKVLIEKVLTEDTRTSLFDYELKVADSRTTLIIPGLFEGTIGMMRVWQALANNTLPIFHRTCPFEFLKKDFNELYEFVKSKGLIMNEPQDYLKFVDNHNELCYEMREIALKILNT